MADTLIEGSNYDEVKSYLESNYQGHANGGNDNKLEGTIKVDHQEANDFGSALQGDKPGF